MKKEQTFFSCKIKQPFKSLVPLTLVSQLSVSWIKMRGKYRQKISNNYKRRFNLIKDVQLTYFL